MLYLQDPSSLYKKTTERFRNEVLRLWQSAHSGIHGIPFQLITLIKASVCERNLWSGHFPFKPSICFVYSSYTACPTLLCSKGHVKKVLVFTILIFTSFSYFFPFLPATLKVRLFSSENHSLTIFTVKFFLNVDSCFSLKAYLKTCQ